MEIICRDRGGRYAEGAPLAIQVADQTGAAVTAGLTFPYNPGVIEAHVNRINMLKRRMCGRAKPDLLSMRPPTDPVTTIDLFPNDG